MHNKGHKISSHTAVSNLSWVFQSESSGLTCTGQNAHVCEPGQSVHVWEPAVKSYGTTWMSTARNTSASLRVDFELFCLLSVHHFFFFCFCQSSNTCSPTPTHHSVIRLHRVSVLCLRSWALDHRHPRHTTEATHFQNVTGCISNTQALKYLSKASKAPGMLRTAIGDRCIVCWNW